MRADTNADKVRSLMRELGLAAKGPGRIYVTGGTTAVLHGWRPTTVDVDLKLDPEPAGIFEALRDLKDKLDMNVELASPDDFVPALPGWQDRSEYIGTFGAVSFFHFDFFTQALSKIERGHARDLADVQAMRSRGLIEAGTLRTLFEQAAPQFLRYPALDVEVLRRKLDEALR